MNGELEKSLYVCHKFALIYSLHDHKSNQYKFVYVKAIRGGPLVPTEIHLGEHDPMLREHLSPEKPRQVQ